MEVALFYKYGFQLIDWVKLPTEEKWHSENLQNIATIGTDIQFSYKPKKGFIYLSRKSIDFDHIDSILHYRAKECRSIGISELSH